MKSPEERGSAQTDFFLSVFFWFSVPVFFFLVLPSLSFQFWPVRKAIVLVFRAKQTSSPCAAGRADQTSTSVFVDVLSHVCNKSYKPPPFPATVPGTLPSPILELVGSDKVGFAVCSHCERKGCSGRRLSGWSRCPRVDFARVRTAGRLPGLVG